MRGADVLFELCDALLIAGPVPSPKPTTEGVPLLLEPLPPARLWLYFGHQVLLSYSALVEVAS
jgi:hypothetical protein